MSVLESIRKRAKLLVVLIGAALVIFVLEDALTSGRFFFGGNDSAVAYVNGKKIKYTDFRSAADEAIAKKKIKYGSESLNDSIVMATDDEALQNLIFHKVLDPDLKKLGIAVSDSELHDMMLGQYPSRDVYEFFSDHHGHILKEFTDPRTRGLNMNAVINFLQKGNEQQQMQWATLEEQIKSRNLQTKYFSLLQYGLFVTDAMAKQTADDVSKNYDISYALKRYSDIPDNSVSVSDQDIKNYYTKHIYEYQQDQEVRKLDYVTFYCNPTSKDMDSLKREVDSTYHQLKVNSDEMAANSKKLKEIDTNKEKKEQVKLLARNATIYAEDSTTIANSDAGYFDNVYHKPDELSGMIDSIMTHSEIGTVYGPYKENNKFKIAELIDVAEIPDSIRVSAIMLQAPNGDYDKIKNLADSLKDSANADNFAGLAQKYSIDGSSRDKGGDLGWFYRLTPTLQPDIQRACFFGNKGDIKLLKENFGYIIIYVTDQGEKSKCYKVGVAVKNILPGSGTRDSVYAIASQFAGKNKSSADFERMARQMNRRSIDIGENDRNLAFENPRDVIRWAYNGKEGDVSDPLPQGENEYIVAHIAQVRAKGTLPLAQVMDEVKIKALNGKKAEKVIADMNSAMQGGPGIAAIAQKTGATASAAKGLTFESSSIPGIGKEDIVVGTMSAMNAGSTSKPIQGELGVYIIHIDSTYYVDKPDYLSEQEDLTKTMRYRVQNDAYLALMKKAGVVENLGRYH